MAVLFDINVCKFIHFETNRFFRTEVHLTFLTYNKLVSFTINISACYSLSPYRLIIGGISIPIF